MTTAEEWTNAFKPRPVYEYFDTTVANYGNNLAADFMGKTWTYNDYDHLVNKVAAGLQAQGIKSGQHIGLCLPNTPYYTIFYFAILKIGCTIVNFNPLYVERELSHQARDADVRIMVTMDLKVIFNKVEAVRKEGVLDTIIACPMADILPPVKKLLFTLFKSGERATIPSGKAHIHYNDLIENDGKYEPVSLDPTHAVAILQYTGGTTGSPKGAMLTHSNLVANIEQMRDVFKTAKVGEEKMICVLPFFHVFAMTAAQNLSVILGAEMILLPRFELKNLLKTIKRKKPTLFPGVPTIYTAINNSPETEKYDLSSLRICLSGGAALPVEVKERFENLTGCTLVEGYGLTETSPVSAVNPLDAPPRAGSIGRLVAGTTAEFRSLDDLSKCVPEGEKGELCLKGPQVMLGYWKRSEETDKAIEPSGFLHTGDVGYQDKDGYIYLVDRIKDLIICSGYNVYPRVIEEAIYQHEAVDECIVIAIPDPYRGQSPKAFIKLKEGYELKTEEIRKFLKGYLSAIEMPHEFEFRSELPKTMIGKLSKKELVEEENAKRSGTEGA